MRKITLLRYTDQGMKGRLIKMIFEKYQHIEKEYHHGYID